jgi:predicted nucleic acid-binding protein
MVQSKPKIVYWKEGLAVRGTQVYLDANFVVGLLRVNHVWHNTANALLEHLNQKQINLVLSSLALNEAIYQLLRLTEKDKENAGTVDPPEKSGEREILSKIEESLFSAVNLCYFEAPNTNFHRQTLNAIFNYGLDPTDAFHYAAARHLNCPLVSNDAGFQKIPDPNLTLITFF